MESIMYNIKTDSNGFAPIKGTPGSAGLDLKSPIDDVVPANTRKLIDTGIVFIIPNDHYGRVAPRSGLALKYSIDIGAGVIDMDYRDSIKILIINNSSNDFKIKRGDRIAQIIFERILMPLKIIEVTEIKNTDRGTGGFGSTGI